MNRRSAPLPAFKPTEGSKDWAHRLRARYLSGEKLIPIQIQLASEALDETWSAGQCSKVQSE